jgi:hypothetical protein
MNFLIQCSESLGPQENSVISQNKEKCKEGKVVANHVFPISSVGILFTEDGALTALHSTLSTEKVKALLSR